MTLLPAELRSTVPLLQLQKVGRQFSAEPPVAALTEVDLTLERGEWLAITGPSGAGKSTLLNVIGCLDRPTSGRYFFGGTDVTRLSDRQRAGLRGSHLGFVFQAFHLLPHRSVLENVMLAEVYRRQSFHGRRARALTALHQVGLLPRADFLPSKLSGGERQRVAIARALVGSPDLLLCDEPTGNLDSASAANLLELLAQLHRQGLTVTVVTHDEQVARRASRRVEIVDGRITADARVTDSPTATHFPRPVMPAPLAITPPGISPLDFLHEALAGLFARPLRTALTALGVVIGITALVATVGISRTAGNRIIGTFNELAATEVLVKPKASLAGLHNQVIPWDAGQRLRRLNGVVAAGTISPVDTLDALVSASPLKDPRRRTAFKLAVQAVSPDAFAVVRAALKSGRLLDEGHSQRGDRIAVLGPAAAQRLGITDLHSLPAIAVGDRLYLVAGILASVGRQPDLLSSVIIPEGTARRDFRLFSPAAVVIETRIGAAALIARQAPLALKPDDPRAVAVTFPPEPKRVREAIQSNLNVLLLLLGGLSLIVGAIGISNITLVSVMERVGEIGLRRALGATRRHIALQFVLESTALGAVGGILGAGLGVLAVIAVSAYQTWTPVLDPAVPLLAPLLGSLVGLVSGAYPALRAVKLEPIEALRAQ